MADNVALKALSQAVKLETEGLAFYKKAAKQTADPKGKAMFLSLAEDEQMHLQMVKKQLHAIEGNGAYVPLPDLQVERIDNAKPIFPPKLKGKIDAQPDEIQALFVALENEIESYNLYASASKETADPAGQRIYTYLAQAEMTHFDLLMSNYESIESMGGWV